MRFEVDIPSDNPRAAAAVARGFVYGLVNYNLTLMARARAAGEKVPELYQSGVVWALQLPGTQILAPYPLILQRGWGDCKDLCAWRVAELRFTGRDPGARVGVYWRERSDGPPISYHAQVVRTNGLRHTGFREDPSRFLGMRAL